MICWFQSERLHPERLGAVLTFTDDSGLMCSLRKRTHPRLIPIRDADLRSVIIKSGNQRPSTAVELLLQDME